MSSGDQDTVTDVDPALPVMPDLGDNPLHHWLVNRPPPDWEGGICAAIFGIGILVAACWTCVAKFDAIFGLASIAPGGSTGSGWRVLFLFLQAVTFLVFALAFSAWLTAWEDAQTRRFLTQPARMPWRVPGWDTFIECPEGLRLVHRRCLLSDVGMALGFFGLACVLATVVALVLWMYLPVTVGLMLTMIGIAAFLSLLLVGYFFRPNDWPRLQIETSAARPGLRIYILGQEREVPLETIRSWAVRLVCLPGKNPKEPILSFPLLSAVTVDGSEVPVHLFEPGAPNRSIAWRTAQELARLTGKKHEHPGPPPPEEDCWDSAPRFTQAAANAQAEKVNAMVHKYLTLP